MTTRQVEPLFNAQVRVEVDEGGLAINWVGDRRQDLPIGFLWLGSQLDLRFHPDSDQIELTLWSDVRPPREEWQLFRHFLISTAKEELNMTVPSLGRFEEIDNQFVFKLLLQPDVHGLDDAISVLARYAHAIRGYFIGLSHARRLSSLS